MKKIVSLLVALAICVSAVLMLTSCFKNDDGQYVKIEYVNELTDLLKGETLHVGNRTFVNSIDSQNYEAYINCVSTIVYSLNRTYHSPYVSVPNGYVRVSENSNYYYYWTSTTFTDEVYIGDYTVETRTMYSYLPYADGESVMVKTTTETSYIYDYEGGFLSRNIEYQYDFNGYFTSYREMMEEYPELADFAYAGNTSDKYYVDANTPATITTSKSTYENTYYYITK